jgi:hypothetical protein
VRLRAFGRHAIVTGGTRDPIDFGREVRRLHNEPTKVGPIRDVA